MDDTPKTKKHRKRLAALISAGLALVLAAGGYAVYQAVLAKQHDEAFEKYQVAISDLTEAKKTVSEAQIKLGEKQTEAVGVYESVAALLGAVKTAPEFFDPADTADTLEDALNTFASTVKIQIPEGGQAVSVAFAIPSASSKGLGLTSESTTAELTDGAATVAETTKERGDRVEAAATAQYNRTKEPSPEGSRSMTLVVPITELAAKMPAFAKEIEQGREVVVAPSGGGYPLATVKPARKGVVIGLAKDWGEPRFSEDWTMTEEDLVGS